MANIITRLLLDASGYSGNLEKAQRSLDKYIEKNMSLGNVVTSVGSALGKVAGAVGVAMGAHEAMTKVIHGSQSTSDEWNNTLNACKDTVDAFFRSLSMGDFTAFNDGLSVTIARMKEVSALRDALADAQLSMAYNIKEAERQYTELEAIARDKSKSKAERDAAIKGMQNITSELRRDVEDTAKGAEEVLIKDLKAQFGIDFTSDDFRNYIKMINNEFSSRDEAVNFRNYRENLKELETAYDNSEKTRSVGSGALVKEKNEAIKTQIDLLKQTNQQNEKYRILNEQIDESRIRNLKDLEYTQDLLYKIAQMEKRTVRVSNMDITGPQTDNRKTTNPLEVQAFVTSGLNYTTQLGQKVMYAMQHDGVLPIIKQPIEIEETVDELPLPIDKKAVNEANDYATSLNAIANVMSAINGNTAEGAAGFLIWASNLATATATAIDAAKGMIAAKTAEGAASAGAEAAKTPFVGWLLVGGAIASALAAFASIPTFAEGGIVPGANFRDGVAARLSSGEMVINPADQKRLYDSIRGGNLGGGGRQKAVVTGEQIVLAVNNYGRSSGRGILIK